MSPDKIQERLEKMQEKLEKMEIEGVHSSEFDSCKADALLLLEEMSEIATKAAQEADTEPEPPEHGE